MMFAKGFIAVFALYFAAIALAASVTESTSPDVDDTGMSR